MVAVNITLVFIGYWTSL